MTNMLQLSCDNGDQVEIREDELATVTEDDLELLGIPRADLNRCFAEGVKLMENHKPSDRVRPIAEQHRNGGWEVILVKYSGDNDPLMQGRAKGTA